jgi:hypothetical protein
MNPPTLPSVVHPGQFQTKQSQETNSRFADLHSDSNNQPYNVPFVRFNLLQQVLPPAFLLRLCGCIA